MEKQDKIKWFVVVEGLTHGPFSTQQTEELLAHTAGSDARIWWRGQNQWISPDEWRSQRDTVIAEAERVRQKTWKLRLDKSNERGPFIEQDLISELKTVADFSKAEVWTEGLVSWEPVYNIHKFMDSLGVCRRQHPRVPINAQAFLTDQDVNVHTRLTTISEGGLGIETGGELEMGQKVNLIIKSSDLSIAVKASATVVYISPTGGAGLRFDYIMPECKAAIIEYVKHETAAFEAQEAA